jgi:hypothetical protein
MGAYLDAVTAKKDTPIAMAHRIALLIDKSGKKALIAEAGEDYFFYSAVAKRLGVSAKMTAFAAHGKPKVLETLDALFLLGKKESSYAIIDRDFDFSSPSYIKDGHCLVLDEAAVESLFIEDESMDEIGKSFFALEEGGPEHELWINRCRTFKKSLDSVLINEHAIALYCHEHKSVCNLNNVTANQLTSENVDGSVEDTPNSMDEFLRLTSAVPPSTEEIEANADRIRERSIAERLRGHYVWQMFVRTLNSFRVIIDARAQAGQRARSRTRLVLNERHSFDAASTSVSIPARLKEFMITAFG